MTATVLDRICADKRVHVDAKKAQTPLAVLLDQIEECPPTRGFINALRVQSPALIAEVKKASPSKGIIREDFDAVEIAKIYEANGAACLSVLTDEPYFQGRDEYLTAVRAAVDIPLLRKDFMIDPYQVYEARTLGADCILLIMAALDDTLAKDLYALATSLSMDTLFEVHDEEELDRALALNPQMVGVNNRNLKTLHVDLGTGMNLSGSFPEGIVTVAESGIADNPTLQTFSAAGYNAFLIGESLMRQSDIGAATRAILGR
ncbi:MAG: indole-3-glycerol phosphate synthase TrpC [Micavibrio aeruginosavorus]|uniref:Indole-3-glycerol phosphate synthase n=1 Tax=Micavibrio aeruginosavorus TaxID=349221 RepID=A0A2W4ZU79_9BACT|nr:MAG: indole-3-glycerol phosphate synthase TrpC [Micavibrio aeruginosavorus]